MACDARCGLARLTSIAISYATMPASAVAGQSAARQLPSPAAMTKSRPVLKLDDGLPDAADAEPVAGAGRQALQGGGDGRQVLGVLPGQVPGRREQQAVP